jgi:hypothetical protein
LSVVKPIDAFWAFKHDLNDVAGIAALIGSRKFARFGLLGCAQRRCLAEFRSSGPTGRFRPAALKRSILTNDR